MAMLLAKNALATRPAARRVAARRSTVVVRAAARPTWSVANRANHHTLPRSSSADLGLAPGGRGGAGWRQPSRALAGWPRGWEVLPPPPYHLLPPAPSSLLLCGRAGTPEPPRRRTSMARCVSVCEQLRGALRLRGTAPRSEGPPSGRPGGVCARASLWATGEEQGAGMAGGRASSQRCGQTRRGNPAPRGAGPG